MVAAGKLDPKTPLEGKFSVPFCIALGLRGYRAVYTDFTEATMRDAAVMELVPRVEVEVIQDQVPYTASMDVYLADGEVLHETTDIVLGHPDNPMGWEALYDKFEGLTEPVLGAAKTKALYECIRVFDTPGSLDSFTSLVRGS